MIPMTFRLVFSHWRGVTLASSKAATNPYLVPRAKVDPGCLMGYDGSGGDGIMGKGDDKGDSGDGDGDGGVGAVRHASMCASKDDGKGV
ncbi:hypothetical protein Tco_1284880 [Tanacetum coccineum]